MYQCEVSDDRIYLQAHTVEQTWFAILVDTYMINGKAGTVKLTESTFSLLNLISLPSF